VDARYSSVHTHQALEDPSRLSHFYECIFRNFQLLHFRLPPKTMASKAGARDQCARSTVHKLRGSTALETGGVATLAAPVSYEASHVMKQVR